MTVLGIDEVGRGCWAGPLVAAAVLLNPSKRIVGLDDSKKLSRSQRDNLIGLIESQALAIGIGWVWPEELDQIGLTASVGKAMAQAVEQITVGYDAILIDGNYNFLPDYPNVTTMAGADGIVPSVSAASIVAKVVRDRYMINIAAEQYPRYGFERHVGYGTAQHIAALKQQGITPIHRRSFRPIKGMVQSET